MSQNDWAEAVAVVAACAAIAFCAQQCATFNASASACINDCSHRLGGDVATEKYVACVAACREIKP
jgi:hypothetical protein